jgi:hypothetical protein
VSGFKDGRSRPPAPTAHPADVDLARKLELTARLVEQLGDTLSADPDMLLRHSLALQNVDIVLQLLAAAEGMLSKRPGSAARLAQLQASAEQALAARLG